MAFIVGVVLSHLPDLADISDVVFRDVFLIEARLQIQEISVKLLQKFAVAFLNVLNVRDLG